MLLKAIKPITFILILLYLISIFILYFIVEKAYKEEAIKRIEQTVRFEKAVHTYVNEYQKLAIDDLVKKRLISKDFFDPRLISSTFISKHIYDNFNESEHTDNIVDKYGSILHNHKDNVQLRIVSDNPTNISNLADAYESKILEKFRKENLEKYYEYINKDGLEYLVHSQPVEKNSSECLKCHGKVENAPSDMVKIYGKESGFNEKIGDLRAVVVLYTPVDNNSVWHIFLYISALALVVFVTILFIIIYFTKKIIEQDKMIVKQSKFAAMGEMIGMIAHQWRQPLTGIGMTVDNLQLDIELDTIDEEVWKNNLESIKKQIFYLSHTVDDFRNFFKPNQKPQEVNLSKLMDDSIQLISSELSKNGIKLYKYYQADIMAITFKNDIMQVILNLLKNANDAFLETGTDEGEMIVKINKTNRGFNIEITDNAGGIGADIIDKIFDPYFSTKEEKNGTGLGLYMSKMIVEEHLGGKLELTTDSMGTSFFIKCTNVEEYNGD